MAIDPNDEVEPGFQWQFLVRILENLKPIRVVRRALLALSWRWLSIETSNEAVESTKHICHCSKVCNVDNEVSGHQQPGDTCSCRRGRATGIFIYSDGMASPTTPSRIASTRTRGHPNFYYHPDLHYAGGFYFPFVN